MNDSNPILDNLPEIKKLDQSNVLGSVQAMADQIHDAWLQVSELSITLDTARIHNVVVMGMGGSGLGPDVIKQAFKLDLTVPLEVYNDYTMPGYVSANSLVLLASYSGTTEEVLSAANAVEATGAQVLCITTGGELATMMKEKNWQGYVIRPQFNPSNQPRMAVGYAVFGAIAMFIKGGLLKMTEAEVMKVVDVVRETSLAIGVDIPQDKNAAKQMAFQMLGRVPVLVGAEHLAGALHVFQNQLNENAKIYAEYRLIPELNHHLMEGLRFPEHNDGHLFFVLFNSTLYHPRTQKRVTVTQDVVEQASIDATTLMIDSSTRLEQAFEVIAFGAYVNFYLAMLEGIDPAPIPTVDYFKDALKK